MPEFLYLIPPDQARQILLDALPASQDSPALDRELVESTAALGRICALDVPAPIQLPEFARATVDGYALRAENTYGASDSLPAYLSLVGEVMMGQVPGFSIHPGECAAIHTGGMLPGDADAVVMLEYTQSRRGELNDPQDLQRTGGEIEIFKAVAVGENVIQAGEDTPAGEIILHDGQKIRVADIGGLMALGLLQVSVYRRPRVAIVSSGDEIIPPESTPLPGQVRDVNSYTLSALIEEAGATPIRYGIVPDQLVRLQEVTAEALAVCDALVITAGSSASARDLTVKVIAGLGAPGVLVHGVNLRPGKPTILGVCNGKPVIGLPGNPVSALVAARLFLLPCLSKISGQATGGWGSSNMPGRDVTTASIRALLSINLASQAGREDWAPVRLLPGEHAALILAEPIFGKSNLILTFARADGLVCIPPEANGLSAGDMVEVVLL